MDYFKGSEIMSAFELIKSIGNDLINLDFNGVVEGLWLLKLHIFNNGTKIN